MTVQQLIDLLTDLDTPDATVHIMSQKSYPFENSVSGLTITNGTRQVVTSYEPETGIYSSRLYVNSGETACHQSATHRSAAGARRWAERTLAEYMARVAA